MDAPSNSSPFFVGTVLILFAVGAAIFFFRPQRPPEAEIEEALAPPTRRGAEDRFAALEEPAPRRRAATKRERRIEVSELPPPRPALPEDTDAPAPAAERRAEEAAVAPPPAAPKRTSSDSSSPARNEAPADSYTTTASERALAELGVDAAKMTDLRRRHEELLEAEAELRQEAQREGWLDSPEFSEELDGIDAERVAIRDEIGDEAYDHFLFATGQMNRVLITGVEQHSPADVAGLRTGDLIVRYDGVRLFAPGDLLAEIDAATAGNVVRLDVMRAGEPLQVEIGDGPLGVAFEATQDRPLQAK